MKQLALGLALAAGLAGGAQAASAPAHAVGAPLAEKLACFWRHGVRVCERPNANRRHHRQPTYRGLDRPENYVTGSTEWWRSMDRNCIGGYRC